MEPIAYSMNNVFITDWNEKDYTRLDFGDIFERFYKEAYGINCPYVMNDNLSVKNEYRIPADEFENVIAQHIGISREELHKLTLYDADSDSYLYRPRGYGEYDYAEVPYPEVVSYKKNDDGSVVLFVKSILEKLQVIIEDNNLVRANGVDKYTQGLPEAYAPCMLYVIYDSGEKLYFSEDNNPQAKWAQDMNELFKNEFISQGHAGNARWESIAPGGADPITTLFMAKCMKHLIVQDDINLQLFGGM